MAGALPAEYRLFIAILIPDEVKDRIAEAQEGLRRAVPRAKVGWTRREQFHLTLEFLGGIDAGRIEELAGVLRTATAGFGALRLNARGIGFFPNPRSPRVVWVGLSGAADRLARLHAVVEGACAAFTREPAQGEFTGHVTLGRIKGARQSEVENLARAGSAMAEAAFGEWTADRIELMRSELLPGGARHTSLAQIRLSAPSPNPQQE
jgi:2'-5' RNA ligase